MEEIQWHHGVVLICFLFLFFAVTKLKGQGGSVSSLASVSDEEGNGDGVKRSGNTEDMAAALVRARGKGRD